MKPEERFGRWVVLGKSAKPRHWDCRCDCGVERPVFQSSLNAGTSVSCGCFGVECCVERAWRHGLRYTPEWRSWIHAKQRCRNPKDRAWKHYGGRGIIFCKRWDLFENFYADLGEKPEPKRLYSIERVNNERGYEPGNCKWATIQEQANNRRNNKNYATRY